jgi:3-oxoacyl-[acyl-carrier-protein] synthase III
VFVDGFAYALGERKAHVRESAAEGRLVSTAADLEASGFRWHHMCEPETGAYELARQATTQLAAEHRLESVDVVVYSTSLPHNGNVGDLGRWEQTRDVKHLMDFPASRLQADFGLNRAFVIGLTQQGCTGMLGAIRLAATLLTAEQAWQRVLCVTADRFPESAKYEQAYNLISDSAAACVVGRDLGGFKYLGAHHITNGGLGLADDDQTVGTFFAYAPRLLTQTLAEIGLTVGELDWLVVQNANEKAWRVLAAMIGFDHAKVCFSTLPEAGHAISADTVLNLVELVASGRLRAGDRVALLVAGTGLNFQCVVLQATEAVVR